MSSYIQPDGPEARQAEHEAYWAEREEVILCRECDTPVDFDIDPDYCLHHFHKDESEMLAHFLDRVTS